MSTATTTRQQPGARSRIDGTLHRWLPAQITLREDAPPAADGSPDVAAAAPLLRLTISVSSEEPYLRTSWWDDPWLEVLGHKAGEVDLARFDGGAGVVLANHNREDAVGDTPLAGIGLIEAARIVGTRLECDVVISRREALADLRQDIADGLVRNVSIGYLINERVLTKSTEGSPDEYRVTSWTPFEVSFVDIPADPTVGIGRAADGGAAGTPSSRAGYRVVDIPPAPGIHQENRAMPQATAPAATPTATPVATTEPQARGAEPNGVAAERERIREISTLGRQLGMADAAERAIEAGTSLDDFRRDALAHGMRTGSIRTAESPEIGLSEREVRSYSFARALLARMDPANAKDIAPFELECSRAAQDRQTDRPKDREAAITIPADVLARGIDLPAGAAASAQRLLRGQAAQRDLVVGTPTAGGNLVATELLGSSFIELLRNALVLDRMGVTMLRDLSGNLAIPSQTGAATSYWVTEGNAPTESQQTIGQVAMTPKTVGAFTDYSRRLLLQSSIDVEAFVRADLAAVIAQAILTAAINGAGSGGEPTGLLNTSGIGAVAGGTNGLAPAYDHMVDLETAVAVSNAAVGNLGYLTNTKVRGKLRKTQQFSGTNGVPVWGKGVESGLGDVLGYDAYVTNAVPSNLTKGTSNGVCSAIMFGNWADMIIGLWGGLDMMLDPYAMSTTGGKRVVALQDLDIAIRRVASFAAMKDALTT